VFTNTYSYSRIIFDNSNSNLINNRETSALGLSLLVTIHMPYMSMIDYWHCNCEFPFCYGSIL